MDTKVWYGNLPHPFFNPGKLWPPECPIVLQLEPNNVSKIFYSNDGHTPILSIVDIAIIDTVLMVDSGISTMSADSMINTFPATTPSGKCTACAGFFCRFCPISALRQSSPVGVIFIKISSYERLFNSEVSHIIYIADNPFLVYVIQH